MKKISLFAVVLSLIVVVLGAYTRLKDAGLGCPDWPGCYGRIIAPFTEEGISKVQSTFTNYTYDTEKAWTEMVHRYVAGTLGFIIFFICFNIFRKKNNFSKSTIIISFSLTVLLIFQALLGKWTVTMRLYPIVVMGHLLGGLGIFSLLWLINLNLNKQQILTKINFSYGLAQNNFYNQPLSNSTQKNYVQSYNFSSTIKTLSILALIFIILQLALGGWTSSNYAALVCSDFPTCQGYFWPQMDFKNAFNLFNVGIFDSPGIALENPARVAIQMSHRIGALITTVILILLSFKLIRTNISFVKKLTMVILSVLTLQIILGIGNILAGLPIAIAVAHNCVGALLLALILTVNFLVFTKRTGFNHESK